MKGTGRPTGSRYCTSRHHYASPVERGIHPAVGLKCGFAHSSTWLEVRESITSMTIADSLPDHTVWGPQRTGWRRP